MRRATEFREEEEVEEEEEQKGAEQHKGKRPEEWQEEHKEASAERTICSYRVPSPLAWASPCRPWVGRPR